MAGILANSASVTMTIGTVDGTQSGFVTAETITLSATPAGTDYSWGIAKPSGSTPRSNLSGSTDETPTFTPDAPGTYTVTCNVDGTDYTLRITATAVAITSVANAHRFSPVTNNSVPTPALGETLFFSSDDERLCAKDTSGNLRSIDPSVKHMVSLTDADSPYDLADNDYIIGCDTTSAEIVINLPTVADAIGRHIVIKDETGEADPARPVTITADGFEKINGASTVQITFAWGSWQLYSNGTRWLSY